MGLPTVTPGIDPDYGYIPSYGPTGKKLEAGDIITLNTGVQVQIGSPSITYPSITGETISTEGVPSMPSVTSPTYAPSPMKKATIIPPIKEPKIISRTVTTITEIPKEFKPFSSPSGKIDLVALIQSKDAAAISLAEQMFPYETMKEARFLAKTPVTVDVYMRLGEGAKKDVRIVSPLPEKEWRKLSEKERRNYYISQEVGAGAASQLGSGVLGRTASYSPSIWEQITPWKEELGEKATTAGGLLMYAELAVPGVYTGRHWGELALSEKVGYGLLDALALGFILTPRIGLSIPSRMRTPQPIKTALAAAKEAGEARKFLQVAERQLKLFERVKAPQSAIIRLKNNVQQASNLLQLRDRQFLELLSGLREANISDIAKMQKLARMPSTRSTALGVLSADRKLAQKWGLAKIGLKLRRGKTSQIDKLLQDSKLGITPESRAFGKKYGIDYKKARTLSLKSGITTILTRSRLDSLKTAIEDVGKLSGKLDKQWRNLNQWAKVHPNPTVKNQEGYIKRLTEIQKTKDKLDRALVRYSEKLHPRLKETPAPEFKGYQMKWEEAAKDDFDRLFEKASRELELKRIAEDVLKKDFERLGVKPLATKVQPKVIPTEAAPKEGQFTLELRSTFVEPAPAELGEVRIPKLKAHGMVAPITISPKPVPLVMAEVQKIVAMTPNQIAGATPNTVVQFHAFKTISSAMGVPFTKINTKAEAKTAAEINAQYQAALASGWKAAVDTYVKNALRGATEAEARARAEAAAEAAVKTKTATLTKTKVKTAVKTQVKTVIDILLKSKFRGTILPPLPTLGTDKSGRKRVFQGAAGWKQGFIYKYYYIEGGKLHKFDSREPIEGIPLYKGPGSAAKSLTLMGSYFPEFKDDMGIVDIHVSKRAKSIKFKPDPKQKTRARQIIGEPVLTVRS